MWMTEIVKLMRLYEWSRYIENSNAVLSLCTKRKTRCHHLLIIFHNVLRWIEFCYRTIWLSCVLKFLLSHYKRIFWLQKQNPVRPSHISIKGNEANIMSNRNCYFKLRQTLKFLFKSRWISQELGSHQWWWPPWFVSTTTWSLPGASTTSSLLWRMFSRGRNVETGVQSTVLPEVSLRTFSMRVLCVKRSKTFRLTLQIHIQASKFNNYHNPCSV